MTYTSSVDLNPILSDVSNPDVFAELMRRAYGELRRIAAHLFKQERTDHTLQPTALVHELYLRLAEGGPDRYECRAQFFHIATVNMRRILVEHARYHNAQKRGGDMARVPLECVDLAGPDCPDYVLLDEQIQRLEHSNPELARVAELRVFSEFSSAEIAAALGIAESTARKKWAEAKAWLQKNATGEAEEVNQ